MKIKMEGEIIPKEREKKSKRTKESQEIGQKNNTYKQRRGRN